VTLAVDSESAVTRYCPKVLNLTLRILRYVYNLIIISPGYNRNLKFISLNSFHFRNFFNPGPLVSVSFLRDVHVAGLDSLLWKPRDKHVAGFVVTVQVYVTYTYMGL